MENQKVCNKSNITEDNIKIKRKNTIILLILITLFIVMIILNITEGFLKIDEHEQYAATVENANITTVMGPVLFIGATYTFMGTCVISFAFIFIKKIDSTIKIVIQLLPLFTISFTIPALFCSCL